VKESFNKKKKTRFKKNYFFSIDKFPAVRYVKEKNWYSSGLP